MLFTKGNFNLMQDKKVQIFKCQIRNTGLFQCQIDNSPFFFSGGGRELGRKSVPGKEIDPDRYLRVKPQLKSIPKIRLPACSFWLICSYLVYNLRLKYYFSLTPNQPVVLSAMTYKPIQPKRIGCTTTTYVF